MKTLTLTLAALVASVSLYAQAPGQTITPAPGQFYPVTPTTTVPAASGSYISPVVVNTAPTYLQVCGSYNIWYYNWQTGALYGCVNGGLIPLPLMERTGTTNNTDQSGFITLVAGAATYTFSGTYVTAPVCTASDTTALALVKPTTTNTTLSITGTGTDVIAYSCTART